jgi:hypothetical protein
MRDINELAAIAASGPWVMGYQQRNGKSPAWQNNGDPPVPFFACGNKRE